jgi:hypothetical protein
MTAAYVLIYLGAFFLVVFAGAFLAGALIGAAGLGRDALRAAARSRRASAPVSARRAVSRELRAEPAPARNAFAGEPAYAGD